MGACGSRDPRAGGCSCASRKAHAARVDSIQLTLDKGTTTVCAAYYDFELPANKRGGFETVKLIATAHVSLAGVYSIKVHSIPEPAHKHALAQCMECRPEFRVQTMPGDLPRVTAMAFVDCACPLYLAVGVAEGEGRQARHSVRMMLVAAGASSCTVAPASLAQKMSHPRRVNAIVASRDLLVSADDGGTVKVWRWDGWNCINWRQIKGSSSGFPNSGYPDGAFAPSPAGGADGSAADEPAPARVRFKSTGCDVPCAHPSVRCLHLADAPELEKAHLFSGGGHIVNVWHLERGRNGRVSLEGRDHLDVGRGREVAAVASSCPHGGPAWRQSATVAAYNTPRKNLMRGAIMPPPNIPKPCWAFVAVVEGGLSSFVQVWDLRPDSGPELQREVLRGHRPLARITALCFGPLHNGPLVSGAEDGSVEVWEVGQRRRLVEPTVAGGVAARRASLAGMKARAALVSGDDERKGDADDADERAPGLGGAPAAHTASGGRVGRDAGNVEGTICALLIEPEVRVWAACNDGSIVGIVPTVFA
jgi:WD40 repeat protein